MKPYAQLMLASLLLAACTSDPGGTNTDFGMTDNTAPTEVMGALQAVNYDPDAQELILTLNAIHGGERNVSYVRTPSVDTNGYEGYTLQRTAADRHYTALFGESNDGHLIAGVVADGGNNNRYFGGGFFGRQGLNVYSPYEHVRDEGEAHYQGDYAGVINGSGDGSLLIDPNLSGPRQAGRVTGTIRMNVDFANLLVDAVISDRTIAHDPIGLNPLPDIVLVESSIDDTGQFLGNVEYLDVDDVQIGNYAGIFGGNGATSVAGTVFLEEFDGTTNTVQGEEEYGVFVLTRCGADNDHASCNGS